MSDIVTRLQQLLTKTHDLVSRYHGGDLNGIRSQLEQLFSQRRAQIMLYGTYNAGKSTLINALLGKEKAQVKDIPTTFRVDSYPWNGASLLDTPGINAPVEHEQVTMEQVQKCGLMLFVIREGDQDVASVYERLFDMVKRGRQVFIVLNCHSSNPDLMALVLNRVNAIIAEIEPRHGVNETAISGVPVCPVNLATALRARLNDSEKLLELSGYTAFENRLTQWLIHHSNENQQATSLCNSVRELWLQPALDSLNGVQGDSQESDLERLQQARTILKRDQRVLEHSAFTFIQQQVSCKKGEVFSIVDNASNSDSMQASLQTLFAEVAQKTEAWLDRELDSTISKISTVVDPLTDISASSKESNPLKDATFDLTKKKLSDKKTLTEALKLGRKMKIPFLKGRWEKTLAKWAGKASAVFQVGFAFYDVYSAGKQ